MLTGLAHTTLYTHGRRVKSPWGMHLEVNVNSFYRGPSSTRIWLHLIEDLLAEGRRKCGPVAIDARVVP
jgi:hypothetical protein